jgi:hypothetical protein
MVNAGILQGIAQYLRLDEWQSVTCWIAKFLHMFFTASPLIPSYEVDNFIFKNGPLLAEWCVSSPRGFDKKGNEPDLASVRGSSMAFKEMILPPLGRTFFFEQSSWNLNPSRISSMEGSTPTFTGNAG